MENMGNKKLALLYILDILKVHSDEKHPLTQENIITLLSNEYNIEIERKAVSRNISLLKEAGYEIESCSKGSYLFSRDFEDSELHLLIDGVLCSKYINKRHSKDLIHKLCKLSNKYFKKGMTNINSVGDRNKTNKYDLFINIEKIDEAIKSSSMISYDFNKYGIDKKLHKTSKQTISPYQLILNNQRYYVVGYNDYWGNISFHKVDRITNVEIIDKPAKPIRSIPGYENGIDYKTFFRPYMFSDDIERVEFLANEGIIDQIIDWFGDNIDIEKITEEGLVKVSLKTSLKAMKYWSLQYLDHIEVVYPQSLRNSIVESINDSLNKYKIEDKHK